MFQAYTMDVRPCFHVANENSNYWVGSVHTSWLTPKHWKCSKTSKAPPRSNVSNFAAPPLSLSNNVLIRGSPASVIECIPACLCFFYLHQGAYFCWVMMIKIPLVFRIYDEIGLCGLLTQNIEVKEHRTSLLSDSPFYRYSTILIWY